MDKSWIDLADRHSPSYYAAIDQFMTFAYINKDLGSRIYCPCRKCENRYLYVRLVVRQHLRDHGFFKKYRKWDKHGADVKDGIWKEVKDNLLNVSEGYKTVCLRCCNNLWKDHKSKTKLHFFEINKEDPDLISKVPANIVTEQWSELVAYWSSEDAKVIARRNSINRELRGPVHTTGRKHFAQLRFEMEQNGEETDKMNVWKRARDQSKPEVVQVIKEYEKRLLLESEDQRNLKVVKDRIFHELIGEDGHGYCRTYGSAVPRRFIYPLAPSSYETTDDLIQKVTESVSKKFQDQLNMLQARIDFLENKEGRGTDQIGQVPDATSDHEIRRESIGEGNPGSSRDRAMD